MFAGHRPRALRRDLEPSLKLSELCPGRLGDLAPVESGSQHRRVVRLIHAMEDQSFTLPKLGRAEGELAGMKRAARPPLTRDPPGRVVELFDTYRVRTGP